MIELKHVSKTFDSDSGGVDALKDVSLTIEDGDIYGIIGMSGAGKSTLVRCINLLEKPTAGEVVVDGQRLDTMTPAQLRAARREITMIFQRFNLLMQRTCLQNVCFPMELSGVKKADAVRRAKELLELVGLPDKAQAYPAQLSGGQQQRIALARALVISPDVLLMDEPLSNLDAKLRVEMRSVIRHTQKSVGITTVYVTHDQEEAMAISDRIAVMKDGVIQHVGTPRDIYQRPKNVFVATFIGRTNIVNAHVKGGVITFADGYHEHIDALDKAAEQEVRCSIRPEEFIICKDGTEGIHGTVQECTYLGLNTHYTIDTDQGDSVEIVEESSIGEGLKKGEKVLLKVKKEKINVFTKDGDTNLIRSDAYEKQ